MPVDVVQLIPQLRQMAARSATHRILRDDFLIRLRQVFAPGFNYAALDKVISTVTRHGSVKWAGARFTGQETINQTYLAGREPANYVLLATDGSQIMPDRHKSVQYAAIQVAGAGIVYGQAPYPQALASALTKLKQKPIIFKDDAQLYDEGGELIPPGEISTERDLMEIELLADLCEVFQKTGLQIVAVADASIVPFALLNESFVRNSARRATELLERIVSALARMRTCHALVAGYIDRPNSSTLARTCSLNEVSKDALSDQRKLTIALKHINSDLRGISDRLLLDPLLACAARTALFEPTWLINSPAYLGQSGNTMRACYINLGKTRAAIARMEFPEWCSDPTSVGTVTRIMERHTEMGRGYPLILKAAHEEAVLTVNDEHAIDHMIERGMIEQGILTMPSSKQEAKVKR